jgi:hypothetical protein
MALEQRIESLKKRHAHLDHILHDEEHRPAPDILRLHELKREKLHIKDEILFLMHGEERAA